MKKFYDVPTQVKFIESDDVVDEPRWIGGIAFQDYVICGECGSIVDLKNLADIIELPWVDITDGIVGDDDDDDLYIDDLDFDKEWGDDDDLDLDEEWGDDGNLEEDLDPLGILLR
jgi:hypothetical protein